MARRRLSPEIPGPRDPARDLTPDPAPDPAGAADPGLRAPRGAGAPIARVAAEAAGQAALDEVIETLRRAEAEGRMVIEIPLDDIAADHIARDRVAPDAVDTEGEMTALVESLRAHGQRSPIEVLALRGPAPDGTKDAPGEGEGGFGRGPRPYGLISGWRRLSALARLHAETGEARFATARALVRRPACAAEAYVAMVEENEIRLGLGQYERARVVALAVERGVFPDEDAALRALFAGASRAKRSRIRAFVEIHRALGETLRFPAHLPERLGLRIVEQLRAGRRALLAAALERGYRPSPETELALIENVLDGLEFEFRNRAGQPPGPSLAPVRILAPNSAPIPSPTPAREPAARPGLPGAPVPRAERSGPPEAGGEAGAEGGAERGAGWRWERIGPGLELGRNGEELRLRGPGVSEALVARLRAALGD